MARLKRQGFDVVLRQSKRIRGTSADAVKPTRQSKRLHGQPADTRMIEPVRWRVIASSGGKSRGSIEVVGSVLENLGSGEESQPDEEVSLIEERTTFFYLAPELRNKIYEYVLVSETKIHITRILKQPGLQTTCRQIRAEAKEMWLYQNEFKFIAFDNDAKLLFRFDTISQSRLSKAFNVQILRAGRWHWQNLMQWCTLVTQHGRYA
ncbi:hypothetical protein Slin15195_G019190 [Septoria linicola]|uniref:Uncharacterized protein n=1 Tax=Septoria linicola TaxID=215465 RepID=A0A9Q9EF58_9PEZI|nr:hypothetical protein Slin15195_G019190 [Septoria linicola]